MVPLLENLKSMNFMQSRVHYQDNRLDKIVSKKRLDFIFKTGETVTDHHFTCLEIQRIIRLLSDEIKTLNHPTLDMEVGSLEIPAKLTPLFRSKLTPFFFRSKLTPVFSV